jgi:hypothetical protein
LLKFTKIRMDFQLTNFFGEFYMIISLSLSLSLFSLCLSLSLSISFSLPFSLSPLLFLFSTPSYPKM